MTHHAMVATPALNRSVFVRADTTDQAVWDDTFGHQYHVPPESMPTPATVLDLGANIGLTVAHYRAKWPDARVVGVEPDPGNALIARHNTDTDIIEAAVSGEAGTGRLLREGGAWGYMLDAAGDLPVVCLPLDVLIESEFDGPVDFCKMDIEGAEWDVFGHADRWAHLVRHLLVELHPVDGPVTDSVLRRRGILALKAAGYVAKPHQPHPRALWAVQR